MTGGVDGRVVVWQSTASDLVRVQVIEPSQAQHITAVVLHIPDVSAPKAGGRHDNVPESLQDLDHLRFGSEEIAGERPSAWLAVAHTTGMVHISVSDTSATGSWYTTSVIDTGLAESCSLHVGFEGVQHCETVQDQITLHYA